MLLIIDKASVEGILAIPWDLFLNRAGIGGFVFLVRFAANLTWTEALGRVGLVSWGTVPSVSPWAFMGIIFPQRVIMR